MLAFVLALALAGCGDDSSGSEQREPQEQTTLKLESPAVQPNGVISPRIICGGGTIWLPLKWSSIPSDSKELVLFFGRYKSDDVKGVRKVELPFAAMVSDIAPKPAGTAPNTYPPGAEVDYFVSVANCPPERHGQSFLVELFALDRLQDIPQDDDFPTRLAEEALGVKDFATESKAASEFREEALATGRFTATYGPPS